MKFIEDAFTVIHIRISHRKILGVKARHFVTFCLILFLMANTVELLRSTLPTIRILSFLEAAFFIILSIYLTLFWIKSWPKAGAMLNKVVRDEREMKRTHSNKD